MSDARHHRAVQVVLVPVPFEGGSPKSARTVKPGNYPRQDRQPWRPATRPPSKGQRAVNLLNAIVRQDEEVREFMRRAREGASHAG
jgi:hypothetical protein